MKVHDTTLVRGKKSLPGIVQESSPSEKAQIRFYLSLLCRNQFQRQYHIQPT